jgi:hypothetical protein
MSEDAAQRPVVVFLSYRRGDTQWAARGIYDRLVNRYGRVNVFRDLDAIPPGARFRDYVEKKISESDVLILLIGKAWASYEDEMGRRRLEQPRDPVRVEVETALRLGVPIIPVRVEGAPMPTERDLVPSIFDLLEFNAAEVSDSRWEYDLDRLLWAINEMVDGRPRPSAPQPAGDSNPPVASPRTQEDRKPQNQAAPITQPHADREVSIPRVADNSSSIADAIDGRASAHQTAPNQHIAPRPATRDPITGARRDADEQARRDAEEQARRDAEQKARRDAEQKARRDAEQKARRDAEQKARRDAEEQARRDKDEAERQVHPRPKVGEEPTVATESSPVEAAEQIRTRSWGTARNLLRQRAVILATVGIGGVAVLLTYPIWTRPVATIMDHLPNGLRASCTADTDKSANCQLKDGTIVLFRLFDTASEAQADVTNGYEIAPDSNPCPPSAPPVNTSVCRYAVGPEKGLAMFGYTAKDADSEYLARWVPDAEPMLRGAMSTKNANPLDWTTLETNWTQLARTP